MGNRNIRGYNGRAGTKKRIRQLKIGAGVIIALLIVVIGVFAWQHNAAKSDNDLTADQSAAGTEQAAGSTDITADSSTADGSDSSGQAAGQDRDQDQTDSSDVNADQDGGQNNSSSSSNSSGQDAGQDNGASQDSGKPELIAGNSGSAYITAEQDAVRKVKNNATEKDHKTNGLAICMYHYVYDENDPPSTLNANYISEQDLGEEIEYLIDNDYYFPTWKEVRAYVDGDLLLPKKSVVLTFDDGYDKTLTRLSKITEKYEIPITSFMITSKNGKHKVEKYADNPYIEFQSHSNDLHKPGGKIGHGGVFTALSVEEGTEDLEKSIEIIGNNDAFAYPFGDTSDSCEEAVKNAGFSCALTTENRRAEPGDDPLLLPRVRMSEGQSLNRFIDLVE